MDVQWTTVRLVDLLALKKEHAYTTLATLEQGQMVKVTATLTGSGVLVLIFGDESGMGGSHRDQLYQGMNELQAREPALDLSGGDWKGGSAIMGHPDNLRFGGDSVSLGQGLPDVVKAAVVQALEAMKQTVPFRFPLTFVPFDWPYPVELSSWGDWPAGREQTLASLTTATRVGITIPNLLVLPARSRGMYTTVTRWGMSYWAVPDPEQSDEGTVWLRLQSCLGTTSAEVVAQEVSRYKRAVMIGPDEDPDKVRLTTLAVGLEADGPATTNADLFDLNLGLPVALAEPKEGITPVALIWKIET